MSQFSRFIREFKIPKKGDMEVAIQSFSKKEWSIFVGLIIVTMVSAVIILQKINLHFMVEIPAYGGTLSEGIIGTPRFINPILAISDADKDLSALVYSGLMKRTADGTLIHDLAESHTISDDELTYTFKLKQGLVFHDGTPITADDVIYTINQAKDPLIKSPRKINWEGVTVLKAYSKL
jgi:peptide/nickel transport system substrate-binding protein